MKITFYFTLFFIVATGICACNNTHSTYQQFSALLERKDTVGKTAEWDNVKKLFLEHTTALSKDTNDITSRLNLTALYLNEARMGNDASYYYTAALKMIEQTLQKDNLTKDDRFLALTYQSSVLLSLHQFADAKKIATQALELNPYQADIYGALVDASVELGEYNNAVMLCDKMLSIRPDLRSYSRASYLRQIFGDNEGAKQAMKMAVDAGPTGFEATEWARVNLGDLYLNAGQYDTAQYLYESALYYRPGYPYAEIGLAKLAKMQKQYDTAIAHCEKAIHVLSESSFVSLLGECYALKGNHAKAEEIHHDVLTLLQEGEIDNEKNTIAKHNGNRELAMAYLHTGNTIEALHFAQKDLALRPENIDANELVAWICYLQKDFANAKKYIDKALITKAKNAQTLFKASLIYQANTDMAKANELKAASQGINSNLDEQLILGDAPMQVVIQ